MRFPAVLLQWTSLLGRLMSLHSEAFTSMTVHIARMFAWIFALKHSRAQVRTRRARWLPRLPLKKIFMLSKMEQGWGVFSEMDRVRHSRSFPIKKANAKRFTWRRARQQNIPPL